ncbi:multidrug DMT transporter [Azospirillum brasilense]|nr:multidrug DMT transporter [Azospirillum brasilense]
MTLRTAYNAFTNVTGAIDRAASAAARLGMDVAGGNGPGAPWHAQLRPASFRGVPFAVIASNAEFGRRVAVHEYPYRDTVWVEDLGRGPRRYSLTGFLMEDSQVYGGGPLLTQRDRLQRAVEGAGEGELVHPSLGRKSVALLRFREVQRHEGGRVIEVAFQFVEAGRLLYPAASADKTKAVTDAADSLGLAAVADFVKKAVTYLQRGVSFVRDLVGTVSRYARLVMKLVDDATNLYNAVRDLPGSFGRFLRSFRRSDRPGSTMTALKASTAARRSATMKAGASAQAAAASTTVATAPVTAAAIQAHVSAVAAAIPSPVDRLRLLRAIATAETPSTPGGALVAALYRRAAIAELARAAASFVPASADEALALRDSLTALIEAEALLAGDQGDDATYAALRRLRAAVSDDLTERGASIARLVLVSSAVPTPSLVLAQRLYQDAARADELVDRARPVHPAFMPTTFQALAD